jgi:hypothetical protein
MCDGLQEKSALLHNVDHEAEALLGPAPNRFQSLRLEQCSNATSRLDQLCKSLARDKIYVELANE